MFRRLLALSIAGLAVSLTMRAAEAGKMVSYQSGSETVSSYLSEPGGSGKKPGLIVIQEWWGLNDFVKAKADEFARKGYVALAPDLYRGKVTKDPDVAHQLMRGLPEDRAMRDLQAAVAYLKSRPDVDTTKIGSIGWCMGGGYSLALALAEPLAGSVLYYGRLVTDPAKIAALKTPLLGNFGGQDQGIPPDSVKDFEGKAKAAGKRVDFKIYPDAGHGFASAVSDPKTYRTEDAKDADARADAFLAKVLGGK
ncbi:MAG TPA: dienelactone hydrolase family protein [Thermoanaerobaculia bacterium]|nr:dienelactone hydrolase family protein [Thermoanaerobaculia bacterium]